MAVAQHVLILRSKAEGSRSNAVWTSIWLLRFLYFYSLSTDPVVWNVHRCERIQQYQH